jgi:hypothetical protein
MTPVRLTTGIARHQVCGTLVAQAPTPTWAYSDATESVAIRGPRQIAACSKGRKRYGNRVGPAGV